MKKLVAATFACSLLGLTAYGQGQINFANFVPAPANINAIMYQSDGVTKLTGPTYEAGLYAGPTAASMTLVAQAAFLTGGGAGYIASQTVTVPTVAGGSVAAVQFVIWDVSQYATFTAAEQSGALNVFAASPVFNITLSAGAPATPPAITGLQSMTLNVPEPGTLALAGLGAAAGLIFRRRK